MLRHRWPGQRATRRGRPQWRQEGGWEPGAMDGLQVESKVLGDGVVVRFHDYGDNGDYEVCGLLWHLLTAMERAKKKKIKLISRYK